MRRTRLGLWAWLALSLLLAAGPARGDDDTWTNTAGGNWGSAGNWSGGVVPTAADNALFTTAGTYTAVLNDTRSINNVTLNVATATVNAFGGNLNLGGTMTLSAGNWVMGGLNGTPAVLTGGTITRPAGGTGTFTVSGDLRLTDTQVNGNVLKFDHSATARLRLSGAANFQPGSVITFTTNGGPPYSSSTGITYESGGTLDNATVNLGPNVTLGTVGGQALTIGPNAVVVYNDPQAGSAPAVVGRDFYDGNGGLVTLTNHGTIRSANFADLYIGRFFDTGGNLSNVNLTNDGLIEAHGFITIHANNFTNLPGGVVRATAGGAVWVVGRNSWVNQGTFDVTDGSTLLLGGQFTRDAIGTVTRSGTNTVGFYIGRMDNSGGTFALTAATGSYVMYGDSISSSAEIVGGAITATGGAKLQVRVYPGQVTGVDYNRLTGVAVGAGVLDFSANYGKVMLSGGTTLAAGDTVTLAGTDTQVAYLQTQQVDGVTFVLSGSQSSLAVYDNNTLTLGPTAVVLKTGTGTGNLKGGLFSATSGGSALENRGLIQVQQGTLNAAQSATFTLVNRGAVQVDAGAIWQGALASDGGTVRGGGQITGNVTFTGTGNQLRPGADTAPGVLTVTGNLALNAGTTLYVRLNGSAPGNGYDRLAVNGTVDLGGAALSAALGGGYAPAAGDKLFVLTNGGTGAIGGTFAGLPDGATVSVGGYFATIGYFGDSVTGGVTGGHDVVLYSFTPVPEPAGLLALGAGALALAGYARRRSTTVATTWLAPVTGSLGNHAGRTLLSRAAPGPPSRAGAPACGA
jgi:hypothetical protein